MNTQVGIVMVNYNGAKFQNECIRSLMLSDYQNYYLIIVDNASTDNSLDLLREFNDERIIVLKQKENCGVAKGNNIGIKKSIELGCTHTLLLNNDTILTSCFLSELLACEKEIVTSKIYFYNTDKLWYAGGVFKIIKGTAEHLHYGEIDNKNICSGYYEYAPTCCMLIKNCVFDNVGFMDEKYFLYFDDTDFCYRAKSCNYKIWLCCESVIFHKVSLSTGGDRSPIAVYYSNRNRLYYIKKFHFGFLTNLFYYLSRYVKIIKTKLKKSDDAYYIKLAIRDCKAGNMFRKDNLLKTNKEETK